MLKITKCSMFRLMVSGDVLEQIRGKDRRFEIVLEDYKSSTHKEILSKRKVI